MSPFSHEPHNTGKKGEHLAIDYFKKHHFEIIDTNYRCRYGEIDIIAKKNSKLHFIEVKTRKSSIFGHPVQAYTYQKQQKIIKSAWTYLGERFEGQKNKPFFQFDLLTLVLDSNHQIKELKYYEHAVYQG